jgi:hypothetical protein
MAQARMSILRVRWPGRRIRMIGVVGWAVIFGLLLLWQGFALANGPSWPTMSDLIDNAMRSVIGRVVLFALWLWIGWHTFVRGWELFLRSP